ncbi:hypothetical protein QYM36_009979 [Artemia franciscana]|uniref:Uncharacterized protein n=1 Tax=Artemia franciscana TaxID=6661 RepID=A0AA88I4B9_ARTSF|nr:hypothetical protein QYM36_009979 [Artemia franciscana]
MVIQYRRRLLYRFQIEEHATYSHLQYSHMVIQYRRRLLYRFKSKSMLHIVTNSIVTSSYMVIQYRGRLLYRFQVEEHATHSH